MVDTFPQVELLRAELLRENEKLRKIVKVLVDRVERSTDAQGNAFSLFQAAIALENRVRQRTAELQTLNRQLQQEVEERRAMESALEHAKVQAERANLGKTEFLSAASHDLLQPLNVARLAVDALVELGHDAQKTALLELVDRSLEAAEELLSALLEMSRIDAGALLPEIADVPIDPLLQYLSSAYALKAEECRLRLRVVPCDAIVRTDLRLLERILRNFLSNALRYTRHGGVLVGCRRRDGFLRIEVWDTGPGIPDDRLADVFKEFLRLDAPESPPGGMGLGLAIVDRLSRVLNARVGLRSRPGSGSVFAIDVPLGKNSRVRRGVRAANALAGKLVLLIEDEAGSLRDVALQLRRWGVLTLEAHSARDAAALCGAHGRLPSAVLVDELAVDGGRAAVESVRAAAGRTIPGVLLAEGGVDIPATSEAGYWYLSKPVRPERLRSLLAHLITNSSS
jgi:signal transduction histidine kinase/CheY-like chemotaxis protein